MRPERICKELQEALPADAVLVSETGHAGIWTGTHLELHHRRSDVSASGGIAGLGAACSLGGQVCLPEPACDLLQRRWRILLPRQ